MFPLLPQAGIQAARDKTAMKKLENTITYLKAELASEVQYKEDVISALTKSEAAYNQLHEDFVRTVERLEMKHSEDTASIRAVHKQQLDAKSAEV